MTEHQHRQNEVVTNDDEAFLAGTRRLSELLRQRPFVTGFLAVAAAALLFRMGVAVGETVYLAVEGDGTTAVAFGGTFVTVLVGLIGLGVWLDRRQRIRDAAAVPFTPEQRQRVRDYLAPASVLVRWYRPIAVGVFVALATPGVLLLGDPGDAMWVMAVLIANPVGRALRSRGAVLTTRDLGFPVPGLSPWPSIATAASAVTAGMAIAALLWAEALQGTVETAVTGTIVAAVIVAGSIAVDRHERDQLARLLDPGSR